MPKTAAEKLAHKLDRLAEPGYYVEFLLEDDGSICDLGEVSGKPTYCGVTYIAPDAKCKYVHWMGSDDWHTLTWSCAPTKKQVEKAEVWREKCQYTDRGGMRRTFYEYYPTWEEFVEKCEISVPPITKQKRAPNDGNQD